jgi:glycosyltransferase involved in cell wall biosynthesis
MVEPENIDEWAMKLENLCADPRLCNSIGQAARTKLEQEYTWQKRAQRAAALFD